jgi:two-component system, cell cycle sensor histidine kinase and response regulator CckA
MSRKSIRTLLVVEDNPGDARLLREMLNDGDSQETELTQVQCMRDAETLLRERPFDIVLLDLGLPDEEGLGAVRRAHAAAPGLPLVVLTGSDDESLARQALQQGAQDYLIKGQIEPRGLMRALRYAIERKLLQEALNVERERLRLQGAALQSTADGVIITDRGGTILWVNPAFCRITGWSAEEATGQNPSILLSGLQDDALYAGLWRTLLEGQVWEGELTNRRKDGQLYVEAQTITPVRDTQGEISHFVTVQRDVSHGRRLEEQLRQSQKMEALGRLSGGVAHDFNNLLGVILGYGDMLLKRLPEEERLRGYCREILKAGNQGAALTRQLLAFSRQQVLQPKLVDLNGIILEAEMMLGRLLGEDVELVTSLDPLLGHVKIDPGQVEQVIMNLALNARDAMPRGGTLTIETTNIEHTEAVGGRYSDQCATGPYVKLTVSDTGVGMDEITRKHIFEPFFTTKEAGKGTGLGLSTVYGVVEQSKGHISVESELGRGARFTMLLPRLAAPATSEREEPRRLSESRGTETVLVVEDDDAARGLWIETLQMLGYKVLEASNGAAAMALGRSHQGGIDLLLTDVVMPRMGGRALAEALSEDHPCLRVIFMSGYTADTILRQGIAETDWPFLQKPFSAQQLAVKIRETLDAPGRSATAA